MTKAKVTVDLTKIGEEEFDGSRELRVASVRGGKVLDQKVVVPAKEKNPRKFQVELSLGEPEDGVAGAEVVVAPADDERNLRSQLAARRFVSGREALIDAGSILVHPGIYGWWRFCWFPRQYRFTGQVVRHADGCQYPIAGAQVQILDVDYCWWWYDEDLLRTGTTDANGFFDITLRWCVPLWCLIVSEPHRPLLVDPDLRDRIRELVRVRPTKFPPPPPPPDPWTWERQLDTLGIELPQGRLEPFRSLAPRVRQVAPAMSAPEGRASAMALAPGLRVTDRVKASDLFAKVLYWPPCPNPCDWLPDIKIRVTQTQPTGSVVIYEDTYWDIHFNLATNLLNLTLEANASALHANGCNPDPILGNCMLLDAVGNTTIMPVPADPLSGIYQPNVSAGVSYGVDAPDNARLGYVRKYDRPWADVLSVYGRFGIAANVDYYQVQVAAWTNADRLAWDADHTYVPPDAAFAPVSGAALLGFSRAYIEESPSQHWNSEAFAPQTVGGITNLYKSRERFQEEYEAAHGGNAPAPNFGGWYWHYFTETRLFDVDTSKMANGLYTFRFVGYRQTGVDGMGNPILAAVNMGLGGGVGKRCGTTRPELLTLYLHDDPHTADCEIVAFKKNGGPEIDECALITLTSSDWIEIEYRAQDPAGHLDSYEVTLQKGASVPDSIFGLAGVTHVSGSTPEGPSYALALVDPMTPAVPPHWSGGTWKKRIDYSAFVALGGSCAYNLRLAAWDRHTNGFVAGPGWAATECEHNRAFTVILA